MGACVGTGSAEDALAGFFEGDVDRADGPLLTLLLLRSGGIGGTALLCDDVDSAKSFGRLFAGAD